MSISSFPRIKSVFLWVLVITFFLFPIASVFAAQVTLSWSPNSLAPDGYRVYARVEGQSFDYAAPDWPRAGDDPSQTTCTLTDLMNDTSYYFVVRAFVGSAESGDSNEVNFVTPQAQASGYTITVNSGSHGAISPGSATVAAGENQSFSILPDAGYHIEDVQVDGTSIGPVSTYTFYQVGADHTISAHFSTNSYEISASSEGNGTIFPGGAVSVTSGGDQRFTVSPGSGSAIADILVDGQSIGAVESYTFFNVSETHTIHAIFESREYIVVASAGPHGDISPSGEVSAPEGSNLAFSVTPHTGYRIADVVVDNISVGPVAQYTFPQVAAAHSIVASFETEAYTITAASSGGGSISPSGMISASAGSSHTFLMVAEDGYEVADVAVDGNSIGAVNSYTFSMVDSDHAIEVLFDLVSQAPVADAGPDQVVDEQRLVTLSGLNSMDADDGIAGFLWRQIGGPLVSLSSVDDGVASFLAPDVDTSGEALEFELIVTDFSGNQASDRCIVNVTWVNAPPVAAAGSDQTHSEGETIVLNGAGSTDSDDGIAAHRWQQVLGPQVVLSNPDSTSPSFQAPDVGSGGATLRFELTVTDNGGLQDTDSCVVTIIRNNTAPVADAGPDHQVSAGSDVALDGSASMDPEGQPLSFQWRQTFGPPVTLTDATAVRPMFSIPADALDGELLTFELTVTDNGGLQGVDACNVVTWSNPSPVADAGSDQQVSPGSDVVLDGSASMDPEGQPLSFQWRQIFGPPVPLSDATAVRPMFSVPADALDGESVTFELTVTDNSGLQGVDTCNVVVSVHEQPVDTTPPVLKILSPAESYVEVYTEMYSLFGSASDDTGVVRVIWTSSWGYTGEAAGTTQWRIDNLKLRRGENMITVLAIDAAGNKTSKEITLNYKRKWGRRYWR